ncbi:MAG: YkgJ family cysteine cluster protein [Candidatus Hodarchaeales archaeon]
MINKRKLQNDHNICFECIRDSKNECCRNVYIVLNSDELDLFKNEKGFRECKGGGIYYSETKCLYLDDELLCSIHDNKPLYCKYYPIFITGEVFVDGSCPYSKEKEFMLTNKILQEIARLKEKYDIYQEEWFWEDIQELYGLK